MQRLIRFLFVSCVILGTLFIPAQFDGVYATAQVTPQIEGGCGHSIALKVDGTVWTWGYNYDGELGDGTNTSTHLPKKLESLSNVKVIAAGYYHNLAFKTDGTLWAWGQNTEYQLGDGTRNNRNVPIQVFGIDNIKAMAAGATHSLVLKEDGTVWAWGTNWSGQLVTA